jgi:predicted alpha/beta-fold hydrolase
MARTYTVTQGLLASNEYRQFLRVHGELVSMAGEPPFDVRLGDESDEALSFEELRRKVLEVAGKGVRLQRFKGLGEIARRWPARPLVQAGFSLGGNFALRVAMQTSRLGIPLSYVLAVCPIIDPAVGLFSLEESAPWFYQAYFMRKWRHSLLAKQKAFPEHQYFEMSEMKQHLRGLTEALVLRHTDFKSLQQYLDGYSVAGDIMQAMQIPATILTARDDPVIPVRSFEQLELPPNIELDIAPYGGHCGFIRDFGMTSFTDGYIAGRFNAVADGHDKM